MLAEALHEQVDTGSGRDCHWATLRHARVPSERAEEFFERVAELASEFTALPRGGDVVYGFVARVYATAHPALPPARPDEGGSR
jgi:hypothetical protein